MRSSYVSVRSHFDTYPTHIFSSHPYCFVSAGLETLFLNGFLLGNNLAAGHGAAAEAAGGGRGARSARCEVAALQHVLVAMAAPAYSFDTSVREWQYQTQALNQQDLDRNFSLATTHLVKWMQAARMDMPWLGPGYRSLNQLEPPMHRRLLVGSQMVQLVYPGVLTEAVDSVVTTRCEVGDIGRTSIEFRYQIFFGTKLVAHATAMMICVGGVPGALKPTPIPADIRTLASPTAGREKASMMAALKDVSKEPPPNAYKLPLTIRFSGVHRLLPFQLPY
jgi:hypothetical protein